MLTKNLDEIEGVYINTRVRFKDCIDSSEILIKIGGPELPDDEMYVDAYVKSREHLKDIKEKGHSYFEIIGFIIDDPRELVSNPEKKAQDFYDFLCNEGEYSSENFREKLEQNESESDDYKKRNPDTYYNMMWANPYL